MIKLDTEDLSILLISTLNGIFYFIFFLPKELLPNNPIKMILHAVSTYFLFGLLYIVFHILLGILYEKKLHYKPERNLLKDLSSSMVIILIGFFFQYFLYAYVIQGGSEYDFINTAPWLKIAGFFLLILIIPIIIFVIPPTFYFLSVLLFQNLIYYQI